MPITVPHMGKQENLKGAASGFRLVLLVNRGVPHAYVVGEHGRVLRTMTSCLNHLDYADAICLLSYRVSDLGRRNLEKEASKVGLRNTPTEPRFSISLVIALFLLALVDRISKASNSSYI